MVNSFVGLWFGVLEIIQMDLTVNVAAFFSMCQDIDIHKRERDV